MTDCRPWTDERVDKAAKLWRDGLSAGAIAERLGGTTRNAVLGKMHRLGLSKSHPHTGTQVTKRSRWTPPRITRQAQVSKQRAALDLLPREPLPPEDIAPVQLVAIVDLEPHHCRWIYGDVGGPRHGCCGKTKVEGLAYCEDHARKCYAAPETAARDHRGRRGCRDVVFDRGAIKQKEAV